jgi:hypothetical protein
VPAKLQGVIGRCDKDIIAYVHSLHKKIESFSELLTFNFDLALHVIDSKAKNPLRVERVAKSKKNAATTGIGLQNFARGSCGLDGQTLGKVAFGLGFEPEAVVTDSINAKHRIINIEADEKIATLQVQADKRKKISVALQTLVDTYKLVESCATVNMLTSFERHPISLMRYMHGIATRTNAFKTADR